MLVRMHIAETRQESTGGDTQYREPTTVINLLISTDITLGSYFMLGAELSYIFMFYNSRLVRFLKPVGVLVYI